MKASRGIVASKFTPEYLVPKLDTLGLKRLDLHELPTPDELEYLGDENLRELRKRIREQERKLTTALMIVQSEIDCLNATTPEDWRAFKPLDACPLDTPEERKTEAIKKLKKLAAKSKVVELRDVAVIANEQSEREGSDVPCGEYKCNWTFDEGECYNPHCRFGSFVAAWCQQAPWPCDDPNDCFRCGKCINQHQATLHLQTCILASADEEMLRSCSDFLRTRKFTLKSNLRMIADYIGHITKASRLALPRPALPFLRSEDWLSVGKRVCVVVKNSLRPGLVMRVNKSAHYAEIALAPKPHQDNSLQKVNLGWPNVLTEADCDFLRDMPIYREIWLNCLEPHWADKRRILEKALRDF